MIDTLGLPTVFFTLSAADLQWPELATLLNVADTGNTVDRSRAVAQNPSMAERVFYHRVSKFMDTYFGKILKAEDYRLRFEYQHRGSPHVHGVAWLQDAPNVENVLASDDLSIHEDLIKYIDNTVSTTNPGVLQDGSNISNATLPQTNPHSCNKPYAAVDDHQKYLNQPIATCQRHTQCSAAYCLRTNNGVQKCHFNYPKQLQPETVIIRDEELMILL